MNAKPPLPLRLLRLYCHPDYLADVEGDLLELYQRRVDTLGLKQARWRLWLDVILLFRPGMIRPLRPALTLALSATNNATMETPVENSSAKWIWYPALLAMAVLLIAWIGILPFNFVSDPVFIILLGTPLVAGCMLIYGLIRRKKVLIHHGTIGILLPIVLVMTYTGIYHATPSGPGPLGFYTHVIAFEQEEARAEMEAYMQLSIPAKAESIHFAKPSTGCLNWSAWLRFEISPAEGKAWLQQDALCFSDRMLEQTQSAQEASPDFTPRNIHRPSGQSWWTPENATRFATTHCRNCPTCEPDYYLLLDQSQDDRWIVYLYGVNT